jgi:hypothetical protein
MSIEQLLNKKVRAFIYATGAGAGAQRSLWNIPGCSSFLVGAGFPYDTKLTSEIISYTPNKFVSKETSAELAMAAYMNAFDPSVKDVDTIGIGLTASVASIKEHRGEHQIFVTAISNNKSIGINYILNKGSGLEQRIQDGDIADQLIHNIICKLLNIDYKPKNWQSVVYYDTSVLVKDLITVRPFFKADGTKCAAKDFFGEVADYSNYVFYPGSFNPFHYGHSNGAKQSFKTAVHLNDNVKDVIFSTCINPKHKAEPTSAELLQRIKQMRGQNFLLTKDDPYFVDKARMFPGAMISMGADVLLSLFDPKWGLDPVEMLEVFRENNVRFLVQGRLVGDTFVSLRDVRDANKLMQDVKYYRLFAHVEGRSDISSTELRNK